MISASPNDPVKLTPNPLTQFYFNINFMLYFSFMENLYPQSGVKIWIFLPPIVALVVSSLTPMAGVSGAFILLPFQVSVRGFTSPASSSTNFVYDVIAISSAFYRFFKKGRMVWSLSWVVVLGTLPGVFVSYYLRILYVPDPQVFSSLSP